MAIMIKVTDNGIGREISLDQLAAYLSARPNVVTAYSAEELQARFDEAARSPTALTDTMDVLLPKSFYISRPIILPAVGSVRVTAEKGVVLQHSGGNFQGFRPPARPERLSILLRDVFINGGWNVNRSEAPDDNYSPINVSGYGKVEVYGGGVSYSRRVGYNATSCGVSIFDGITIFACCRDATWSSDTVDITIRNSLFQYVRDDIGCHVRENNNMPRRVVRFVNNRGFQAWGFKCLGGGDVTIENNSMDLPGPYGVFFGYDAGSGEGQTQRQTGYVVRGNTFRNFVNWPTAGKQWCIQLFSPGYNSSCVIEGNKLIALPAAAKVNTIYPDMLDATGEPMRVFDKTQWYDPALDPSRLGIIVESKNAKDESANIVRDNEFIGQWSPTVLRKVL